MACFGRSLNKEKRNLFCRNQYIATSKELYHLCVMFYLVFALITRDKQAPIKDIRIIKRPWIIIEITDLILHVGKFTTQNNFKILFFK